MKAVQNIKEIAGRRALRKELEPDRLRGGCNFNSAQHVGLLYIDSDEAHYNFIRNYARFIREKYGVKNVSAIGFVNEPLKRIPVWQSQKLDFSFFSKDDLSWNLKPINNVQKFVEMGFDMLIDLSGGNNLPLNFILKQNKAKMKVGMHGTKGEKYYDFLLNMGPNASIEKFAEQLNMYLSNPKIK